MVSFPKYKTLQCTNVCENHTLPYNDFLNFYYSAWIETLNWVRAQDIDVTDKDQLAQRDYIVDLHQLLLDLVREGQSWDQLYRNVKFSDEVKSWTVYDRMHTLNILGMFRWLCNHRRDE